MNQCTGLDSEIYVVHKFHTLAQCGRGLTKTTKSLVAEFHNAVKNGLAIDVDVVCESGIGFLGKDDFGSEIELGFASGVESDFLQQCNGIVKELRRSGNVGSADGNGEFQEIHGSCESATVQLLVIANQLTSLNRTLSPLACRILGSLRR